MVHESVVLIVQLLSEFISVIVYNLLLLEQSILLSRLNCNGKTATKVLLTIILQVYNHINKCEYTTQAMVPGTA